MDQRFSKLCDGDWGNYKEGRLGNRWVAVSVSEIPEIKESDIKHFSERKINIKYLQDLHDILSGAAESLSGDMEATKKELLLTKTLDILDIARDRLTEKFSKKR